MTKTELNKLGHENKLIPVFFLTTSYVGERLLENKSNQFLWMMTNYASYWLTWIIPGRDIARLEKG
jgi:hypothetical protein